jgi:hypothetical protein
METNSASWREGSGTGLLSPRECYHHHVVSCRMSLLLLVYLTLDFANPLMPGAVQFEEGSVQVVQADRARPTAFAAPISVVQAPEAVIDRPEDRQTFGRLRLATDMHRRAVIRIRRPRLPTPPHGPKTTSPLPPHQV